MRSRPSSPSSTPGRSPSTSSGPLLVTGFGPFLEHERNPSQEAVCRYAASAGREVVVAVLAVDPDEAPARALDLAAAHGAGGLLAFGLGSGAAAIKVERLGVNRFEHAGAARDLVPSGPVAYWSTLPVTAIRDAIVGTGKRCEMSLSAGLYVCNALLYRALEAGLPAAFVHLPSDIDTETGARVVAAAVDAVLDSHVDLGGGILARPGGTPPSDRGWPARD